MPKIWILIAALLLVAGVVHADGLLGGGSRAVSTVDSQSNDNSLAPGREAPTPAAVYAGMATLGTLGWIRRRRRRAFIEQ